MTVGRRSAGQSSLLCCGLGLLHNSTFKLDTVNIVISRIAQLSLLCSLFTHSAGYRKERGAWWGRCLK